MSFSSEVKAELKNGISSSKHCRLAELSAMVVMTGEFHDGVWQPPEDNSFVVSKADKLIKLLDIDINSEEGKKSLKLIKTDEGYTIDNMLVERSCCKQAYLRGAFLGAGSITNPEKGYHFEIVCDTKRQAEIISDIINSFDVESKSISRKKYYVVYVKDGSHIVDLLNVMGAHTSLMNMENVRIIKDVRNNLNRQVNCEAANLNKTVSAAVKQINDIEYIHRVKGIKHLPEGLRRLAELRVEFDQASLKELGDMLNPPLGKSGVNHRLRKISEIADELRRS